MKKLFALLLVLILVFYLAGCGVKEKIEEKVGEKITEKIVENVVGDEDTKVDLDGGKITIKDKDGGEVTFGGTDWPEIDYIPEFKEGNVVSVISGEGSAVIIVEEVEQKDFENYYENIKEDFTENAGEMRSQDVIAFFGEDSNGNGVQLTYEIESKTFSIAASKGDN